MPKREVAGAKGLRKSLAHLRNSQKAILVGYCDVGKTCKSWTGEQQAVNIRSHGLNCL